MDVRDDKGHRRGTLVFDPMRSRAGFGEDLAGVKLLCRSVVMVIGQNSGEQVDDGRIASMAVQSDMAARRHDRPAEAQFAICDAVDLLAEIDRGEHVLGDRSAIGWRTLLPQKKASGAKTDRSERKKVMALAQAREIDAILVTELSRWGRSTIDLMQTLKSLQAWDVSVLAVSGLQFDLSTPRGKMITSVMAALAEFERDLIRERIKSGIAAAKAR